MTPQQRLIKLAATMRGEAPNAGATPPPAAGPSMPGVQNMTVANPTAAIRPPVPPAAPIPDVPGPSNAPMTTPKQPSIKTDVPKASKGSVKMSAEKIDKVRDTLSGNKSDFPSAEPVKPPEPKKHFKPSKPGDFKTFRTGATSGTI